MNIQGEQRLALARTEVWRALNDPAVLKRCLPGCDTFEADGADAFRVAMVAAVGPVKARFTGRLRLSQVQAPSGYTLQFEGSGGVAGFGSGQARVHLQDDGPGHTRLVYDAQAQVGGRLSQVGARLIEGVTRRMADDFFARFARELAGEGSGPDRLAPAAGTGGTASRPASAGTAGTAGASSPAMPWGVRIATLAAVVSVSAAVVAVSAAIVAVNACR